MFELMQSNVTFGMSVLIIFAIGVLLSMVYL